MNKNILSISYFIISMIVIIVLIIFLIRCKKESFCACRNMTSKRCPDPSVLTSLYNSGKLTEFTDFAKIQKSNPKWKQVMPDDIFNEQQMRERQENNNNSCAECGM